VDDPIFKPRFFAPGRQQAVAFWLVSWFWYPWSVARTVWCGEGWSPKHPKDILTFDPLIGWIFPLFDAINFLDFGERRGKVWGNPYSLGFASRLE